MRSIGPPQKEQQMNRFFADKKNITGDGILIDDALDIHHITRVLRLKEGSFFEVFDSEEWEYKVELISVSPKELKTKILDKSKASREPETRITLFQGIPKGGKPETIIRESVELGVKGIVPVVTARTDFYDKRKSGAKTERFRKVAEEAAKQCRRVVIPEVSKEIFFADMINIFNAGNFDTVIFAYENEENRTIKTALRNREVKPGSVALVIGPEGGFSEEEAEALTKAGAVSVSLGKTVLRTETAGPAAIAMIMYELEL